MFYICLFRNYVINVQPLNIQRVKFLENGTNSQSYALQRSGKLPSNKEKLIFYNFCFTLTDISVSGVTLLAQMWFKMHGTIKVLYKVKSHSLLNAQNWIIRPTDGYDWRVWCPCHTPSKIGLSLCDSHQLEPRVTQLVLVSLKYSSSIYSPPQAVKPDWVCQDLGESKSDNVHQT